MLAADKGHISTQPTFDTMPRKSSLLPLSMTRLFHVRHIVACVMLIAAAGCAAPHLASTQPRCSREVAVDQQCEIALDQLHPTQTAVGMLQVDERVARLSGQTDFSRYTSRPIPIVQAPDGGFYLTDNHHLASVLARVGVKQVKARIIGRFDNPATFWNEMAARRWVYLYDTHGKVISPSALPRRIDDMTDDPYRALAGYAEDAGYFEKTDAYYMEFDWARYFGAQMNWRPIDRASLPAVLQSAGRLACRPEAKELPGYKGPCASK